MKAFSGTPLSSLLGQLKYVKGLSEISGRETDSGFDFEASAKIETSQSFTSGMGFQNTRRLANIDVEVDVLKQLDQMGFDAHISRPIEVRNDGSFAVNAKPRKGFSL